MSIPFIGPMRLRFAVQSIRLPLDGPKTTPCHQITTTKTNAKQFLITNINQSNAVSGCARSFGRRGCGVFNFRKSILRSRMWLMVSHKSMMFSILVSKSLSYEKIRNNIAFTSISLNDGQMWMVWNWWCLIRLLLLLASSSSLLLLLLHSIQIQRRYFRSNSLQNNEFSFVIFLFRFVSQWTWTQCHSWTFRAWR